jgi:hypothetical protein
LRATSCGIVSGILTCAKCSSPEASRIKMARFETQVEI